MQAEQELLQGGSPLETVQKLCDVHAALFRGATSEEKIANAEKAVAASVKDPVWKYKWVEAHEPDAFNRAYKWLDV